MTARKKIGEQLDTEFAEYLFRFIEAQRDVSHFRERLITLTMRYHMVAANSFKITRKQRKLRAGGLQAKAFGLSRAISSLPEDSIREIGTYLSSLSLDKRWQDFDFRDEDSEIPEEDKTLSNALDACELIERACQLVLEEIERTKGAPKGSANPALDQLINDLAALFEAETGLSARSQCYRSETALEEFGGLFFNMTKSILDRALPQAYGSSVALGRRIERLLARE